MLLLPSLHPSASSLLQWPERIPNTQTGVTMSASGDYVHSGTGSHKPWAAKKKQKKHHKQLIDPKELNAINSLSHSPVPIPELNSSFKATPPPSFPPTPLFLWTGPGWVELSGWCI